MERLDKPRALVAGSAIGALALIGASAGAVAQDASPAADAAAQHPLHIHSGTCEQLGDVVFPFGFISQDLMVNGEPADGEELGAVTDQDVALNVTNVDATIADLTAADHALNVHESEEAMDVNIACADIGGTLIEDDTLVLKLEPTDDSGYLGFVLLKEDEDQTVVYTMMTQIETPATGAEPPAAEASAEPSMDAGAEPSAEPSMDAAASAAPSAAPSMVAEPSAGASAEPSMEAETSAAPVAEESAVPSESVEVESPEASPED
jgi:hypothetical protein